MEKQYLLSVDQSTQGTKALLFDQEGNLICRGDRPHRQIINDAGWVSHDLNEIYSNTLKVVRDVIEKAGIRREQVAGLGISNQRETSAVWDRTDGHPLADAIVWQCSRAKDICARVEESGKAEWVRRTTGINLSPYFPASKLAWFMENVKEAPQKASEGTLCLGTIDSYLVYRLTGGASLKQIIPMLPGLSCSTYTAWNGMRGCAVCLGFLQMPWPRCAIPMHGLGIRI